jgi:hypothetical protein
MGFLPATAVHKRLHLFRHRRAMGLRWRNFPDQRVRPALINVPLRGLLCQRLIRFTPRDRDNRAHFTHIFQNIGMTIALLPITGVPLPLISYSGSLAFIIMFGLGIVNSVWIHRREVVER